MNNPPSDIPPRLDNCPSEAHAPMAQQFFSWGVLSVEGRMGRDGFWTIQLVLLVANLFTTVVIAENRDLSDATALFVVSFLWDVFAIYLSVVTQVKRWHDRGKSGAMVLLNFTVIALPWVLVELGFLPGTKGPNRYGPAAVHL